MTHDSNRNKPASNSVKTSEWRGPMIAAACILVGFGVMALLLPPIMLMLGERSQIAAGIFGVLFVLAFFGVFWLRARQQKRRDSDAERGDQ